MKNVYIGFPIKDGCHKNGCDKGIKVINNIFKLDKILDISKDENDIKTVEKNDTNLAKEVNKIIKDKNRPITIGGDHSLAIGSIAGSANNYDDLGVIWFDTHPDCNTSSTTTTFNIHGYPLAASMGFGQEEFTKLFYNKTKVSYNNVVLFSIDDIDTPEKELLKKYNIKNFTLNDIQKKGIDSCVEEAISYLKLRTNNIHLSFDIDSIKKTDCPGVNVPNQKGNGLNKEDALLALKKFINNLNIVSMDIVEYNPLNDINDKSLNIVKETINIIENRD